MTRDDPEIGPEKLCNVCGEWWPLDEEFWYFTIKPAGQKVSGHGYTWTRRTSVRHVYSRCRACWNERSRRDYAAKKSRAQGVDASWTEFGDKALPTTRKALDSRGVEPTEYRGPR